MEITEEPYGAAPNGGLTQRWLMETGQLNAWSAVAQPLLKSVFVADRSGITEAEEPAEADEVWDYAPETVPETVMIIDEDEILRDLESHGKELRELRAKTQPNAVKSESQTEADSTQEHGEGEGNHSETADAVGDTANVSNELVIGVRLEKNLFNPHLMHTEVTKPCKIEASVRAQELVQRAFAMESESPPTANEEEDAVSEPKLKKEGDESAKKTCDAAPENVSAKTAMEMLPFLGTAESSSAQQFGGFRQMWAEPTSAKKEDMEPRPQMEMGIQTPTVPTPTMPFANAFVPALVSSMPMTMPMTPIGIGGMSGSLLIPSTSALQSAQNSGESFDGIPFTNFWAQTPVGMFPTVLHPPDSDCGVLGDAEHCRSARNSASSLYPACERCHRVKKRCVRLPEDPDICIGCAKRNHECVPRDDRRRRNSRRVSSDALVGSFTKKIAFDSNQTVTKPKIEDVQMFAPV